MSSVVEGVVDVAGEVALDAAADFSVGLPLVTAAFDVGLGWRVAVHPVLPAAHLAEVVKLGPPAGTVAIADANRFGLSWGTIRVSGSVLGQPFPDDQTAPLLAARPDAEVHAGSGELLGAVERKSLRRPAHVRICVQLGDGVLIMRGNDEQAGESEEIIKADLIDALRGFAGRP